MTAASRIRSPVWGKLLLVCGSALGCVLLVDLLLLAVYGPVRVVEDFYAPEPRYGYRMRSNLEFVFASPYHGYEARVRTNARGLRDDDFGLPKPRGLFRVLLLGDSFTAGLEVDKDDTFEAVCERALAVDGPVEVINAGVRGYNLDNILGFFAHEGRTYEPDLVLYLFAENDLTNVEAFRPEAGDVSRGFTLHGFLGRIATYSHLTYRLEILRATWQLRRQRDQPATAERVRVSTGLMLLLQPRDAAEPAYALTAARICRLDSLCRAAGSAFVLAGAPHREEIDPETQVWWRNTLLDGERADFDSLRRYLAWAGSTCGLTVLDPVPDFRRRRPDVQSFWFHQDGHLNARGHRLLGELMAARIRAQPGYREWLAARDER